MKQLSIVVLLLCFSTVVRAQHPGFTRIYRHAADSLDVTESVSSLILDSAGQYLFFSSNGTLSASGASYTVFYKTNMQGDVLIQTTDSLPLGNVGYNCVAQSEDGQYLYWAGNSYVQGDTASLSWKIRKTDKDLNVVWDQLYPASSLSNTISNIKSLNSGYLMLLCFDYTKPNSIGKTVKSSTMFMRKIDTAGNIIADYHPVDWPDTDAWGMERTSDGGFVINGNIGVRGYIIKTDSMGNHLSHQFYGSDNNKIRFLAMAKQTATDSFFSVGQKLDDNEGSDALALKTNKWGMEIWHQEFNANHNSEDTFFAVTTEVDQYVVYAGVCKSTFLSGGDMPFQIAAGYMVEMDKENNIMWKNNYRNIYEYGYSHYLYKVISLPDGGYIAGGTLMNIYPEKINKDGAWLLRVDENGCYNPECREPLAIKGAKTLKEEISLFPNPSSDIVHLVRTRPFPNGTTVTLVDAAGKILRTLESPSGKTQQVYQLRGSLLPGVYFIRIAMGEQVAEKKLVLTF